jgi:hypothetical protein
MARALEEDFEENGDAFWRRLLDALYGELIDAGKHWRVASRISVRRAKLARRLLNGQEQRAAARQLQISERTAKSDAAPLQRVEASGALRRHILLFPPRRRGAK